MIVVGLDTHGVDDAAASAGSQGQAVLHDLVDHRAGNNRYRLMLADLRKLLREGIPGTYRGKSSASIGANA